MNDNERSIRIDRTGTHSFTATNVRGGRLSFGEGQNDDFTPVELLLVALAGCSAIDVEYITARRAEPVTFGASAASRKVADDNGNHLDDLALDFQITFPEGPDGDKARAVLERAVTRSRDRLCTVSRTIQLATPVSYRIDGRDV